jgi:hypothetical protein
MEKERTLWTSQVFPSDDFHHVPQHYAVTMCIHCYTVHQKLKNRRMPRAPQNAINTIPAWGEVTNPISLTASMEWKHTSYF